MVFVRTTSASDNVGYPSLYYANNSVVHLTLRDTPKVVAWQGTLDRLAQEWLQNLGQKLAELTFIRDWEYQLLLSQIMQPFLTCFLHQLQECSLHRNKLVAGLHQHVSLHNLGHNVGIWLWKQHLFGQGMGCRGVWAGVLRWRPHCLT